MSYTFLSVNEFCSRVGIDRRTWDNWQARGMTPRYRKLQTGKILISEADYAAWVESQLTIEGVGARTGTVQAVA